MTTLTERLDKLPPARRKKIEARANELIAEEMSLQDLAPILHPIIRDRNDSRI